MIRFAYVVRLLAAGFTQNWEAYDNVCDDIHNYYARKES